MNSFKQQMLSMQCPGSKQQQDLLKYYNDVISDKAEYDPLLLPDFDPEVIQLMRNRYSNTFQSFDGEKPEESDPDFEQYLQQYVLNALKWDNYCLTMQDLLNPKFVFSTDCTLQANAENTINVQL